MSGSDRPSKLREKYLVEMAPEEPAKNGKPSASATYRNILAKDKFATLEMESLHEVFQRSVRKFAGNACLGWREAGGPYQWDTYQVCRLCFRLSSDHLNTLRLHNCLFHLFVALLLCKDL